MTSLIKRLRFKMLPIFLALSVINSGCATGQTKQVVIGMLLGGATGAIVGSELLRAGENRELRTQNTIISSVVGALIVGGALAWHYNQLQQQSVEISGQYARYRLCNPDELSPDLARKLGIGVDEPVQEPLMPSQIGALAISLDDTTKWAYPVFRKRSLLPEKGDSQVLSSRYIWEIMRPGSFVTRSQNPQYFFERSKDKQ